MHPVLKSVVAAAVAAALLLQFLGTGLAAKMNNPLIEPYAVTQTIRLPNRMVNILLLGLDLGTMGYWGSGWDRGLEDCHTDAVMVVSINLDTNQINLLSLPRDTVTYVPEVRGIYKLNAAVNCAPNLNAGLQNTKHCVEWLLGGVKIDYFFAVDMNTMIALGDAIGGIDFDVEMNYRGHSGTTYKKGMQHLDGIGITDYLRARTNATVNGTDLGRTNRQREIILAIFEKLRSDENAIWKLLETTAAEYDGFFTDITMAVLVQLIFIMPKVLGVDVTEIGTYVMTGKYRNTLDWNFTYTDQDDRIALLKDLFGIEAEPIPYVSSQYAKWLLDDGFSAVKTISVSQQLRDAVSGINASAMTAEQSEVCAAFEAAYQKAVAAFDTAAESMAGNDTDAMDSAKNNLRNAAEACAAVIEYQGEISWTFYSASWWKDSYVNQYQVDWK